MITWLLLTNKYDELPPKCPYIHMYVKFNANFRIYVLIHYRVIKC